MLTIALICALLAGQNPPAPGFDLEGSDAAAIELADRCMEAMGGREAWDRTRYLAWTFMGVRRHWWDRYSGDFRIEGESGEEGAKTRFVLLANVDTRQGRVFLDGVETTDPELRSEWLDRAYKMWVNDSYWVFMPYKLKDSGVTLRHLGGRQTADYGDVEVLELRFHDVGVTPQNRYEVFFDPRTHLVCAWSYFREATDEEPRFTLPWREWTRVGQILLAADHGRDHDWNLRSYEELPDSVFQSAEPVTIP